MRTPEELGAMPPVGPPVGPPEVGVPHVPDPVLRGVPPVVGVPDLPAAVARWASGLAADRCPVPRIVAVDGRSGSGKSTLSRLLCRALRDRDLTVRAVHLDDLYAGWDALASSLPVLRERVLLPLRTGSPGRYTSWDWHRDRPGGEVVVPARDVVVVEGVGSVCADPAAYALSLWVTAPRSLRERRVRGRDGVAMSTHWLRWAAQEEELFGVDTHPRAPVVVDAVVDTTAIPHRSEPGRSEPGRSDAGRSEPCRWDTGTSDTGTSESGRSDTEENG